MPYPSRDRITSMLSLNPGTVLSCPACGMGLYMLTKKVTRDGSFSGAVKPMAHAAAMNVLRSIVIPPCRFIRPLCSCGKLVLRRVG